MEREKNQSEQERVKSELAAVISPASEGGTKFHDSALGTSITTPSLYAETVMSYRQDKSSSVRIPVLPEGARDGKEFECVAFGKAKDYHK